MVLEILGTGCAKCKALHAIVLEVVAKNGIDAEVRKVEDVAGILQRGVLSTPALLRDGRVLVAGRLPTEKEVAGWLAP